MANKSVKYKLLNSKLTAVISVSMVLFLLGLLAMSFFMSRSLSDHVKENFIFKLTLSDSSTQKQIENLSETLKSKDYVKSVAFISKEQAVEELRQMLGEDPMEFLDANPLPNCFEVSLKANDLASDSLEVIVSEMSKMKCVREVDYPRDLLDDFTANMSKITVLFLIVAGLLLFISFALINNTIRLLIYSDRFLINTMKQVGATRSFIRKPYMREGLVIGLVASVLASAAVYALMHFVEDMALFVDVKNGWLYLSVLCTIFFFGILITEVSTYLAVNKYLRHKLDILYII